ncbi:O-antigen polysaccharide polymerase Wzy [Buttiauxella gaviniae]|uniref:O-antigen polysaccharide polymerase Wzy n=1 Tax=Buttiauxella gaviniae TaxID=82990 RepID=A0ABV3NXV6_9ENTR
MESIYLYINVILLFLICVIYLFLLKSTRAPRLFIFYLLCFVLFNESHIILTVLSDFKFGNSSWFFLGGFSDEIKFQMVNSLNSYIIGMILSMCLFSSLRYKPYRYMKNAKFVKKISLIIYIISIPFVLKYLIALFLLIRSNGFYAIYELGGVSGSGILDVMFIALYSLLINSEKKIRISILIVLSSLIYIVIGLRLEFIFKIFPVVFYFVCLRYQPRRMFTKKVGWIFLSVFVLIYIMQYSVNSRNNDVTGDAEQSFVYNFLSQQGVSINVLGMAIKEEKNTLLQPTVILAPIIEPIKVYIDKIVNNNIQIGNSSQYAESSLSLSHKLSYIEDRDAYLKGYGVGGSAIAELYLLGGTLGCFIGGFFTFIFILIIERIATMNLFFTLFAMGASAKMIYSPRGEYLSFLSLDRATLLLVFISIIVLLLKNLSIPKRFHDGKNNET